MVEQPHRPTPAALCTAAQAVPVEARARTAPAKTPQLVEPETARPEPVEVARLVPPLQPAVL
jgi:hypothetical protein